LAALIPVCQKRVHAFNRSSYRARDRDLTG